MVRTDEVRSVEYTLQPGDRHPWHYHSEVSDRIYCLEGLVSVTIRTPFNQVVLRPGESHEVSLNPVHRVGNAGDGISRYLLLQAFGKYDFIRVDEEARAG